MFEIAKTAGGYASTPTTLSMCTSRPGMTDKDCPVMGSGLSHTSWVGFRENLPERLDRLIGEQSMPLVVVAGVGQK